MGGYHRPERVRGHNVDPDAHRHLSGSTLKASRVRKVSTLNTLSLGYAGRRIGNPPKYRCPIQRIIPLAFFVTFWGFAHPAYANQAPVAQAIVSIYLIFGIIFLVIQDFLDIILITAQILSQLLWMPINVIRDLWILIFLLRVHWIIILIHHFLIHLANSLLIVWRIGL